MEREYLGSRLFKFQIMSIDINSNEISKFQRYEFKYLLPANIADSIQENIENFMTLDPNIPKGSSSYFVRSQYFENEIFSNFYEKVDGMRKRHKYRLRTYADNPSSNTPLFLEKKGRKLERTMKGRIKINPEHLDYIYSMDSDKLLNYYGKNGFMEGFIFDYFRKKLKPTIIIDYNRSPYMSEFDTNFRLTFDRNIRACIPYGSKSIFCEEKDQYWENVNPGYCTLEVKFLRRFPPWFRRIIQNYNLRRLSISKFSTGIEARGLASDTGV